jgi:vanillate O-demethylase ferredoxin subunit
MPMIEAAINAARQLGWRDGRLHFEIFTAPQPKAGDQAFEVVLKNSGESFHIPAGKSILDVLIEAGKDPLHDCKRGDCGICQVEVVEGVPDHRDFILTDSQKAAGKLMQICVSRSKTPRLVLDL